MGRNHHREPGQCSDQGLYPPQHLMAKSNVLATSPVCQFAKKLDYRDRVCFSPGREKANWWRCCCGEQRRQRERCRIAFRTSPETEAQPLNVPLETGVFVSWRQRWWLLVWQVLLTTSSFYLSAVTTTPSPAPPQHLHIIPSTPSKSLAVRLQSDSQCFTSSGQIDFDVSLP